MLTLYALGLSAMVAWPVSPRVAEIVSSPFGGTSGYRFPDDRAAQHYAAIVESSEDAIISKDLDGVITSWNRGAQRLFGYVAEEVVGKPVMILIPSERENEEPMILERIRRGERIEHYETVRCRKDGSLVDISITVSPIRDSAGKVVGASKIARDITERRRAHEQQELLLQEMNHRIKNLFALAGSVVSLSGRTANSVEELTTSARERLSALARAHELTLSRDTVKTPRVAMPTTLHSLIRAIVGPYEYFRDVEYKTI
jgi:PAS domain S-box-containing protein